MASQQELDHNRRTYGVAFPSELKEDDVLNWLRQVSATLHTRATFRSTPTVVFETYATNQVIQHYLTIPWQDADYIIAQLHGMIPGVNVSPTEHGRPLVRWGYAEEFDLVRPDHIMAIPQASSLSTSLLLTLGSLATDESVLFQWIISPIGKQHITDRQLTQHEFDWREVKFTESKPDNRAMQSMRAKYDEPNFLGCLRIAGKSATPISSEYLVANAYRPIKSLGRFKRALVFNRQGLIEKTANATSPRRYGAQLNAVELVPLLGWPVGSQMIPNLPRGASRQLPPIMSVPRTGIVIGESTFPGAERPVALSHLGGMQHAHIMGGTGAGKTTMLANMAEQDMQAGHTVIVMEAKGDLFYEVLDRVPTDRINDVIVLDVKNRDYPVGYNILKQGDPRLAAGNIKNLFEHHFPELQKGSPWARSALHRGLETLATTDNAAFTDIAALFSPSSRTAPETDWKENIIRNLTDYELTMFWQRFDNLKPQDQERYAAPLMDRAWIITETPEVRNIFGQTTSSFTFDDVLKDNKILLINLSGIAADAAALTGTLFMQGLWTAVQNANGANKPAYLYLDEFQSFLRLPVSPEEMLAKARSFKLGMRLAHQNLDQLSTNPQLRSAVMANARNKVCFQMSSDDSSKMAREFGDLVTPQDFQNLRLYEVFARVVTDEGVSPPFSVRTYPPSRPTGQRQKIIELSRSKYGRPVQEVIQDMRTRRSAPDIAKKSNRPTISGEDFWA